jgi:membrane protease YdiL (CAAX protease family)
VPRAHALGLFLFGSYGIVGAVALGFALLGGRYEGRAALVLGVLAMWVPFVVAAALTKWGFRLPLRPVLGLRLRPDRYYAAAWLLPVVVLGVALLLACALPGVDFSLSLAGYAERIAPALEAAQRAELERQIAEAPLPPWLLVGGQALFAGLTVNALAALGEEAGWRGYLFAVSEGRFWPVTLATGLLHGLWHAPLVLLGHNAVSDSRPLNLALTVSWCVVAAPLFSWVRARSGSAVAAAIAHGTFNALAGVPLLFLRGGDPLLVGPLGLAWQAATLLVVAFVVAWDARLGAGSVVRLQSAYRTGPTPV